MKHHVSARNFDLVAAILIVLLGSTSCAKDDDESQSKRTETNTGTARGDLPRELPENDSTERDSALSLFRSAKDKEASLASPVCVGVCQPDVGGSFAESCKGLHSNVETTVPACALKGFGGGGHNRGTLKADTNGTFCENILDWASNSPGLDDITVYVCPPKSARKIIGNGDTHSDNFILDKGTECKKHVVKKSRIGFDLKFPVQQKNQEAEPYNLFPTEPLYGPVTWCTRTPLDYTRHGTADRRVGNLYDCQQNGEDVRQWSKTVSATLPPELKKGGHEDKLVSCLANMTWAVAGTLAGPNPFGVIAGTGGVIASVPTCMEYLSRNSPTPSGSTGNFTPVLNNPTQLPNAVDYVKGPDGPKTGNGLMLKYELPPSPGANERTTWRYYGCSRQVTRSWTWRYNAELRELKCEFGSAGIGSAAMYEVVGQDVVLKTLTSRPGWVFWNDEMKVVTKIAEPCAAETKFPELTQEEKIEGYVDLGKRGDFLIRSKTTKGPVTLPNVQNMNLSH